MNWQQLLNTARYNGSGGAERPDRPNHVQDADRIIFSAPYRRLANKTQVHPLYDIDHLRHRMIHSQEVASVGRNLGMLVGHWLETEGHIAQGEAYKVAGTVHAAALAHDIGNPPFGHSGEASIGRWFAEKFEEPRSVFKGIDSARWEEFIKFEGNAQGFRILTRLEMYRGDGGMRLSNAVLGAFTKYPMTAAVQASLTDEAYVGAKKFGVFEAEAPLFAEVAAALGLKEEQGEDGQRWWRRHPLVFLVEAADDICYNIVDLEDGFSAGDLPFEKVATLLEDLIKDENARDQSSYSDYEKVCYLRARAIGKAIDACVEAFQQNYDDIMAGRYSGELIADSRLGPEFAQIKSAAKQQLFTAPRKTKLEVRGRNVIRVVLDGILPVFEALERTGWDESQLPDYERQLVRAVALDLRDVRSNYEALHAMTDFVSGMTDRYAVEVAELLSGT